MSRSLLKDREALRPLLESARGVLSEWDEWLEVSRSGGRRPARAPGTPRLRNVPPTKLGLAVSSSAFF
ncbi:MAG: hypothetical protein LBS00_08525 [Synergistaceae bacterium]|nr:hypothetical protein [Synergistaceae bacterium]